MEARSPRSLLPLLLRCLLLLAVLPVALAAQGGSKFALTARFEPAAAAPGAAVRLVLQATVDPAWHAYGSLEATNIPVALNSGAVQWNGLEPTGPAQIPPGVPTPTPIGTSYPLPHRFEVVQPLRVPAGASGSIAVSGALDYQICDANSCLPPAQAKFAATLTIGAGAAAPPVAQEPGKPALGVKPGLVLEPDEKFTVRASFEPAEVRAGETSTLVLHCRVVDGWHAYGTLETTNVPVGFDPSKQDKGDLEFVGPPDIPPGDPIEMAGLTQYPLPHEFDVRQAVRVPAGTEPGDLSIEGVLDYQICDESKCDLPAEAEYRATLKVVAGAARAEHAEPPPVARPVAPPTASASSAAGGGDSPFASSWLALILACIGGGLFALAMPCTYPMIPITFSFFTKQAEKRHASVLPLAIVYGLGIVAMFTCVGVLLSAVIIDVVNHWITNVVIGVLFFFFAFVLFGWVNLNPPQWLQNAAGKAGATGGLLGVFFMGAALVITSFTCTAPIVGSLIAQVARLGTLRVGVGMAVFGLTMALPFVLLALMPTKVKQMPKSGQWMETLKVSLGFVELAAAFKFVSMVDFYFGWKALPRELFLMLWAAIFGLWAMYLFGILRKAGTANEGVGNARMASGMFVTLLAAYFFFGALGNRLDALMTSFVPGYSNSLLANGGGKQEHATAQHTLVYDDPAAALQKAKADGKLLLYNFTGFN